MSGNKKDRTNCCVYGCRVRRWSEMIVHHFHKFPVVGAGKVRLTNEFGVVEEIDRRLAWDRILLMDKKSTRHMRVCSKHFKPEDYINLGYSQKCPKLKKIAVPSLCLPKRKCYVNSNNQRKRLQRRQVMREEIDPTIFKSSSEMASNLVVDHIEENESITDVIDEIFRLTDLTNTEISAMNEVV